MNLYNSTFSIVIGYLLISSSPLQSSDFSELNLPPLVHPTATSSLRPNMTIPINRFSPTPDHCSEDSSLSSDNPFFIDSTRSNSPVSNNSLKTNAPNDFLSPLHSQKPSCIPVMQATNSPKKHRVLKNAPSQKHKDFLYMGCAGVITAMATQAPKITEILLQRFEGSRSQPTRFGALIAAHTALAALPTVLSIASLTYGLHTINRWIYGDVYSMIEEEKAARIRGDQNVQERITEAITTTHQANNQISEVIATLRNVQANRTQAEAKVNSLSLLMHNLINQVTALRNHFEIQDIKFDSNQAINNVVLPEGEESKEDIPNLIQQKPKSFASLSHSISKKYSHLTGIFYSK